MGTALALVAVALIALGGWWIFLASGARRWTTERDPLGEPPVKMAALIAAIVIGVALVSTGGGGAEHRSSMEQGFEEASDGLLSGADGASSASAAEAKPTTTNAAATKSARAETQPGTAAATTEGSAANDSASNRAGTALPSYGKLVVRARKAARARGAEIHWYPTLAAEAREATARRSR